MEAKKIFCSSNGVVFEVHGLHDGDKVQKLKNKIFQDFGLPVDSFKVFVIKEELLFSKRLFKRFLAME